MFIPINFQIDEKVLAALVRCVGTDIRQAMPSDLRVPNDVAMKTALVILY